MTAKKAEIYLRKPLPGDVDFMLRLENDPAIWEVSQTTEPFTREDIELFIRNHQHDLIIELQQRFVIVLQEREIAVGCIDLFSYDADEESAGVGVSVLPEYRRQGFARQALKELVRLAFQQLKLKKLYCSIFVDNTASIHLFTSCGFREIKELPARFETAVSDKKELYFELRKEDYGVK